MGKSRMSSHFLVMLLLPPFTPCRATYIFRSATAHWIVKPDTEVLTHHEIVIKMRTPRCMLPWHPCPLNFLSADWFRTLFPKRKDSKTRLKQRQQSPPQSPLAYCRASQAKHTHGVHHKADAVSTETMYPLL
ncbi:hypothetical protein HDK77DRAFT_247016 [Phyllosticta capitalensis]|uniref:Secreted protein n=1 Tax=Phyllosticta capitalensis TaxID=121624 RepID=A0ABR1YM50_9PEZI